MNRTEILPVAESVSADGRISGEAVNSGNAVWYRVDHNGQDAYIYSGLMTVNAPPPTRPASAPGIQPTQPAQPAAPVQQQPPPSNNTRRPANCAEAFAMGLTDVEAAQWPHLDRDKDGVACYGD